MIDSSARHDYLREAMHREFARRDFLERLAAHAGIAEGDEGTDEQFAAFDAFRRKRHEAHFDGLSKSQQVWAVRRARCRFWMHMTRLRIRHPITGLQWPR